MKFYALPFHLHNHLSPQPVRVPRRDRQGSLRLHRPCRHARLASRRRWRHGRRISRKHGPQQSRPPHLSLENNGGFSSIQNNFDPLDVSGYQHAILRLKGDGKDYRFIVESDPKTRHYYVAEFGTSGDWQEIKIPLRTMYPVRRGDRLDLPDYPGRTMSQVRFMIANGRAESFRLEIASIRLE